MVSISAQVAESQNGSSSAPPAVLDGRVSIGDAESHLPPRKHSDTVSSDEQGSRSMAEDETSPTSTTESQDGLWRTESKVASLRAAFEKQTDDEAGGIAPKDTVEQLERLSMRSKEQEAEAAKCEERHDMGLTKMIEEHELEIARLKDEHEATMEKEEELRQAYEKKCTGLEEEIEAYRHKLAKQEIERQLEMETRCNHLHRERNQAQEEARNLQRQLSELKKSISTATRIEHQISDSTFAQEFTKFFHETQNWIVNNYRKMKTEANAEAMCARLGSVAEGRHWDYLRPIFEHFDSSIKLAAFQATVASYMMDIFNDAVLFGIPSESPWRHGIALAMETLPEVLPSAAFNRWRAMTLDTLGQCKGDEMKQAVDSASRGMAKKICNALNALTEAEESEARVASLDAILKRATASAHLFRVQRARYDFSLPLPGAAFDLLVMEDISVESDDWSSSKGVRCAVWPCVIKHGDEEGNNMELSNVVVKSRVLCG